MHATFKGKIDGLLRELRSWDLLETPLNVRELADKFGLEPFIIQRIAGSEGIKLRYDEVNAEEADPDADTKPIDLDEIHKSNEDCEFEDADTGVWRRNRLTGEWEYEGKP